jgi:hypothetical protein
MTTCEIIFFNFDSGNVFFSLLNTNLLMFVHFEGFHWNKATYFHGRQVLITLFIEKCETPKKVSDSRSLNEWCRKIFSSLHNVTWPVSKIAVSIF